MPRRTPKDTEIAATQDVQHAIVSVAALTAHPRNYRRHPESQVARLGASLARFGQVRSIVVQEGADGRYLIVAGHGLAEAARANGYTELRADVIPATWTPTQIEGYLIADNETTRGADDDLAQLASMLEEQQNSGYDLESLGYSEEELAALLEDLANGALNGEGQREVDDPDGGGDDFDTTPDESGPTRCQPGDLWQLGDHRLACGDTLSEAHIARLLDGAKAHLVVTSPPYNQQLDTFKPSGMQKENPAFVKRMASSYADSLPEDEYQEQQIAMLEMIARHMAADGSIFYNHKIRYRDKAIVSPMRWLTQLSFPIRQEIIWNRSSSITLNARMFMPADERIYWLRVGDDFVFNDTTDIKAWSTVWTVAARNEVQISAAFAVEIPARCIAAASNPGDIVLEPYGGSGTTLIAAERLSRVCYINEFNPRYCDVILRRWEAETGREATLLERAASTTERVTEEAAHATPE